MCFYTHLDKVYAKPVKVGTEKMAVVEDINFDLNRLSRLYTVFRHWSDTRYEKIPHHTSPVFPLSADIGYWKWLSCPILLLFLPPSFTQLV